MASRHISADVQAVHYLLHQTPKAKNYTPTTESHSSNLALSLPGKLDVSASARHLLKTNH